MLEHFFCVLSSLQTETINDMIWSKDSCVLVIKGSKIVFTNGSQDPWRHASKQVSSPSLPSYLISCDNCGHGTDRKGCPLSPLVPEGPYFFGHKQYSLHQSNLFLNKL
ncbi:putative alpha/Beta hydrolase [Helianthus annuus]|nr:putative alpha/Beta hydrolase [Helianthus annuus]